MTLKMCPLIPRWALQFFVGFVFCVDQAVTGHNVRRIVFTLSAILKSREPLEAFNFDTSVVIVHIGMFPPLFYTVDVGPGNGLMPGTVGVTYDAKQTPCRAWCSTRNADHWTDMWLPMFRLRKSMVLQGSHIINAIVLL